MEREPQPPSETKLRPATAADVDAMALITDRATAARENRPLPDVAQPATRERLEACFLHPSLWSRVIEESDQPVAYVLGFPALVDVDTVPSIETQELNLLMVDPDHWRQGFGGQLLDWAIESNRRNGTHTLAVGTAVDNLPARSLYESRGFVQVAETYTDEGLPQDIHYELSLLKPTAA